jgi:hypothetical protein
MNFENNIKKYIDAVNKKLECYLSPKYPEDASCLLLSDPAFIRRVVLEVKG